jgi:kynurenine 3-monooxygenase
MSDEKYTAIATIVGGGLVGSLEAIYLARLGYKVDVYERGQDVRNVQEYQGRSINLAMSDRGFAALRGATGNDDLVNDVLKNGVKMYSRYIHHKNGTYSEIPYGSNNEFILSIDRRFLNEILVNQAAKEKGVDFHFEHKCITLDLRDPKCTFFKSKTEDRVTVKSDLLFGCDGAHSQVRSEMQKRLPFFSYSQHAFDRTYKELSIPATKDGKSALDHENCLHIWPREDYMMIALPNPDHNWTLTLFMRHVGEYPSFEVINTEEKVIAFVKTEFPDILDLMPTLLQEWHDNKVSPLMYALVCPFNDAGRTVLLGDAAHPIIPFYGQGVNAGFEDCLKLDGIMRKSKDTVSAFKEFSKTRKTDVDAICELSILNFKDMAASSGSKLAILEKKIGLTLNKTFPFLYTPVYPLVAFSPETGYRHALNTQIRQEKLTKRVIKAGIAIIGIAILGVTEHFLFPGTFKKWFDQIKCVFKMKK